MSNYRFKNIQLRAFHREKKKMFYSCHSEFAFIINGANFQVLDLNKDGSLAESLYVNDTNSILMQGAGYRDKKNTDIYEGDVLFVRRPTPKGLFPIIGVVNGQDYTFTINSGLKRHMFDYSDKDVEVLGNDFQNSDEELAEKSEALLGKYQIK